MIAEGWEMFKEVVEAAGTGDLPQLLRLLRGMTTLTTPPAGPVQQESMPGVPMEVAGVSGVSPVKKKGASSEPVVVVVGVRKWACPQCSTVRGSKNGCDTHIRQAHTGKVQGCHSTGKTGNLKVHFSRQGKHREFAKKY